MVRIIGSTCVGSFSSPWLEYCVASVYNVVDQVVVANGGYERLNPTVDNKMLERESKALKEIDVNGKITEVKGDWKFAKFVNPERDTIAARNMSIGIQTAFARGAEAILEFKCDQIFYKSVKLLRTLDERIELQKRTGMVGSVTVLTKHSGYQFWEYTNFVGDLWSVPEKLKDKGCDDGPRFFKPTETDYFSGQGQPAIRAEQFCTDLIQAAHMRDVYPEKYSKAEWEQFGYERAWAHLSCQNAVMEHAINREQGRKMTPEEIEKIARASGRGIATQKGVPLHSINDPRSAKAPPLAALTEPLQYIKQGYPL